MSLNEAGQQQQQDQVAGRSSITIRVGASSTTPDTPSSGSDGPVSSEAQINSSPAHPASDVDAGRHGNSSQQREERKRSSVNITVMYFSFILVDATFKGISQSPRLVTPGTRKQSPSTPVFLGVKEPGLVEN